jgi:hypothetical protein
MSRVSLLRTEARKKHRRYKHETWRPHLAQMLQSKTVMVMMMVAWAPGSVGWVCFCLLGF